MSDKRWVLPVEVVRNIAERLEPTACCVPIVERPDFVGLLCDWITIQHSACETFFPECAHVSNETWYRWIRVILLNDIKITKLVFDMSLDILRRTYVIPSTDDFKGHHNVLFVALVKPFLIEELDESGFLTERSFTYNQQFLCYPWRANLCAPDPTSTWTDFVVADGSIDGSYKPVEESLSDALSRVGLTTLDYDWHFMPRHGPGVTSDVVVSSRSRKVDLGSSIASKFEVMTCPRILAYALKTYGEDPALYFTKFSEMRSAGKFIPVPKSLGKMRSICAEPTGMQFIQQGFRNLMENLISNSRLRDHINFHDLRRNWSACRKGSQTQEYSTIDLSSASDLISHDMMKRILKGHPIYGLYLACRTPEVTYKKNKIFLKKAHSSGNALCFPMETLLFSLCCIVAIEREKGSKGWSPKDFLVYGDDIIIRSRYYASLVDVLTEIGAIVNDTKSFSHSLFTESCGKEYYRGHDVTPVRVPRTFRAYGCLAKARPIDDAKTVQSLIALANALFDKGFCLPRRHIIWSVFDRKRGVNNPVFGEGFLKAYHYRNCHLDIDRQASSDYQRKYVRYRVPFSDRVGRNQKLQPADEAYVREILTQGSLMQWFVISNLNYDSVFRYHASVMNSPGLIFKYSSIPEDILN